MLSSNLGLALASLTAWGFYGYLFSRERRSMRGAYPNPHADRDLAAEIRNALMTSQVVSNPRAICVRAHSGYVTLSGDVFWSEVNEVMSLVRALPHVKGVCNRLHAHHDAAGVPALQGRPYPANHPPAH